MGRLVGCHHNWWLFNSYFFACEETVFERNLYTKVYESKQKETTTTTTITNGSNVDPDIKQDNDDKKIMKKH